MQIQNLLAIKLACQFWVHHFLLAELDSESCFECKKKGKGERLTAPSALRLNNEILQFLTGFFSWFNLYPTPS